MKSRVDSKLNLHFRKKSFMVVFHNTKHHYRNKTDLFF